MAHKTFVGPPAEDGGSLAATNRAAVVPVLLYHRVGSFPGDRYTVDPASFAAHMQAVLESRRVALTISELAHVLSDHNAEQRAYVAVTFDDGYAETLGAVRSMAALGLPATVYVTTGWIGSPGMLTRDQVRILAEMPGVELGSHTATHPYLDELEASQVRAEIVESRDALTVMGAEVRTFAYPHGAYDALVRAEVINAGFTSAVAVKNALSHVGDDPWAIARYTLFRDTPLRRLTQVADGRGERLAWTEERWRTRAYRTARRAMRRKGGVA